AIDCAVGPGAPVEIFEIQGDGEASPLVGQMVLTESNIVTAVTVDGFFIQTPDARSDNDDQTSDGLFVFTNSAPTVAVGDEVDVLGMIEEFFDLTRFADGGLAVTINSSANGLPTAVDLDASTPDPGPFATPDLERLEGMLVNADGFSAVSGSNRFGDVAIAATAGHKFRGPGLEFPGMVGLPVWDGNQEVFELDPDGAGLADAPVNFGQLLIAAEGPLSFAFGDYQLLPTTLTLGPTVDPLAPVRPRDAGELTLASLNLARLFDDVDDPPSMDALGNPRDDSVSTTLLYNTRRLKLARYITSALDSPDVLAVQEVESLSVLEALATEINGLDGSVNYSAALVEGNDLGTIDVGFLVRSGVTIVNTTQLAAADTFDFDAQTRLIHDRPPLLIEAVFATAGQPFPFAAMALHNRSLSGIEDASVQQKRLEQAQSIAQLVEDFQTANPAVPLAVLGDMNAFEFTDGFVDVVGQTAGLAVPADNLLSGPNLVTPPMIVETARAPAAERYTFIFGGVSQALDHALITQSADVFVRGLEYGRGNVDAAQSLSFDDTTPLAASDHDGLVLYLMSDRDGDAVPDDVDNCPEVFNPDQTNSDGDTEGDLCDADQLIFFDDFESGNVSAWASSSS
ncbi:MAG: hypothetical protein AAF725_25820, partial [Acidobacteriota bacterium]